MNEPTPIFFAQLTRDVNALALEVARLCDDAGAPASVVVMFACLHNAALAAMRTGVGPEQFAQLAREHYEDAARMIAEPDDCG